ncbi:MAG TPA: ATP-binding protein, partial [Streptosporangiaceae bacterium]|nr:ATP-binding protein [Streptosporangiaceae bacterium]
SPRVNDLELIATELVTNAIQHTPSGGDGGQFTINVQAKPGWARVEVSDEGTGQWHPRSASADDEYGRGLAIVAALAERFGHDAAGGSQTVWAEVTWPEARHDR